MRILFIFCIVLLFYYVQRRVYIKNCSKQLSSEVYFNSEGIFEGEELKVSAVILNNKLLPLWWLALQFKLPRELTLIENKDKIALEDNYIKDMFFVMPYERITKSYQLIASRRGYFTIDNIELQCGDIFGDYRVVINFPNFKELYVYPKLLDLSQSNIIFQKIIGDIISKKHAIEDPFLLKGIREYYPFDSMKTINWKATARTSEFKVNQFDNTYGGSVCIILDVSKGNGWFPLQILEESISIAASLSRECLLNGIEVEVITNGKNILTGSSTKLHSEGNNSSIIEIYKGLSLLDTKDIDTSPIALLKEELNAKIKHKTIIFISPHTDAALLEEIQNNRLMGFNIKWIVPEFKEFRSSIEPIEDLYLWEVSRQ